MPNALKIHGIYRVATQKKRLRLTDIPEKPQALNFFEFITYTLQADRSDLPCQSPSPLSLRSKL